MDTHTDLQAGTQAQTQSQMGAHANMPSLALVSLKAVTHRAVQSGDWSDPATWENGDVPTDWAKVHIPAGVDVRIDGTGGASVKTVRVDGTLSQAVLIEVEGKQIARLYAVRHPGKLARLTHRYASPSSERVAPFS